MNLAELQHKLLAAARLHPPDDRVPHSFSKGIMSRLPAYTIQNPWELWGVALWRAAAPCVAVLLLAVAWTLLSNQSRWPRDPLAVSLENTVRAPLDNLEDSL
jgi:hypothetical protein